MSTANDLDAAAGASSSAEDLHQRAALLGEAGRHGEAVALADRALELRPDLAPAIYCRAVSLLALGEARAAGSGFERYLELEPGDPAGYNNLALALIADQRYEAAVAACDRAIALRPGYARAHNNRAVALLRMRQFAAALAAVDQAVRLEPGYTKALINRATAQRALGQPSAALESFRAAFPDPDALAEACYILMLDLHRGAEARECALLLYKIAPERDGVAGLYHHASQYIADWSDFEPRVQAIVEGIREGRSPTFPWRFLYSADLPAEQQLCARTFARRFREESPLWKGEIYRHDRIRIAYLSSDFHQHATAYLAAGLFERHDRARFECYGLSYGPTPAADPMRNRLQAAFEHFIDVDHCGAREVAARIRELEIDILVDLKGYTTGTRIEILSHRPAPVQIHYLGYPGTLGASCVDYLIADRHVVPPHERGFYDERLVYLPYCYQVTDDRRSEDPQTWTRERAGLPQVGVVLCGFHQTFKLGPALFDVWMRLLHRLPGAILWLLERDAAVTARLEAAAAARGVDPARLIFAPKLPQSEHLGRLRVADLLLDTWPCGAHTTASDALWMGLPVVALRGRAFAARVSSSILQAAGFAELIADSPTDYEALVYRLAAEPQRLRALRARIEGEVRDAPLFNTAAFCRHLELAYQTMWARSQRGLAPDDIAITSIGCDAPI
jgi:predicted O-linked N-acetylglucosamine transferase (SPINDLY family)